MENAFVSIFSGSELERSCVGTTISITFRRASDKSPCEEIALRLAVDRAAED
jgi:hypothetical protein